MSLGTNIKNLRLNKRWTQKELAEKAGITRESIGNYEREDRTPPADILKKLAMTLGVNTDTLTSDESFDFEILFVATQLIWDYFPSKDKDDSVILSEYANVDYNSLRDFDTNKISDLPLDCRKGILNFISEKSPNEFNEIYNYLIKTNIYNLDDELKKYCQELYVKTINKLDIHNIKSSDEFLMFITALGYPVINLNNETLKYLYEKVAELLEFEFYKLEKNNFNLPYSEMENCIIKECQKNDFEKIYEEPILEKRDNSKKFEGYTRGLVTNKQDIHKK